MAVDGNKEERWSEEKRSKAIRGAARLFFCRRQRGRAVPKANLPAFQMDTAPGYSQQGEGHGKDGTVVEVMSISY